MLKIENYLKTLYWDEDVAIECYMIIYTSSYEEGIKEQLIAVPYERNVADKCIQILIEDDKEHIFTKENLSYIHMMRK